MYIDSFFVNSVSSYWDPAYDSELIRDRVALNLLYVQAVTEVECGWVLCNEDVRQKLASLQAKGSKGEVSIVEDATFCLYHSERELLI